jgi:hypothetical protein
MGHPSERDPASVPHAGPPEGDVPGDPGSAASSGAHHDGAPGAAGAAP